MARGDEAAAELTTRLGQLGEPSREDLFVLVLTWLQRHVTVVTRALRQSGRQLATIDPLPTVVPAQSLRALLDAQGSLAHLAEVAVAAARALDQELAETNPRLLTGEHAGVTASASPSVAASCRAGSTTSTAQRGKILCSPSPATWRASRSPRWPTGCA